jgi:hypothetical protein
MNLQFKKEMEERIRQSQIKIKLEGKQETVDTTEIG